MSELPLENVLTAGDAGGGNECVVGTGCYI